MRKELFDISEEILRNYNNVSLKRELKKKEDSIYKKISFDDLKEEIVKINQLSEIKKLADMENYQLSFDDNFENLLIRRVESKLTNEFLSKNFIGNDPILLGGNILFMNGNLSTINAQLSEELRKNIDVKFLYLLSLDPRVRKETKNKIFKRIKFLSPTLEDDFLSNMKLEHLIEKENEFYKHDDYYIETYDSLFKTYLTNNLNVLFERTLLKQNGISKIADELYLRSLLVYLDNDTVKNCEINIGGVKPEIKVAIEKYFDIIINGVENDKKILKIKH